VYIHGFMLRHTQLIGYGGATVIAGGIALARVYLSRRARRLAVADGTLAGDGTLGADEVTVADEVAVIEPTAVFSAAGSRDTGSYRVLTTGEISERAGSARS
jgi:hypothetical protein